MIDKNKNSMPSKEIKETTMQKLLYYQTIFIISCFYYTFWFVQSDNLHYLNFVAPANAATLIFVLGIIIFLEWLLNIFEKKTLKYHLSLTNLT